jgi:hypothetical protein
LKQLIDGNPNFEYSFQILSIVFFEYSFSILKGVKKIFGPNFLK